MGEQGIVHGKEDAERVLRDSYLPALRDVKVSVGASLTLIIPNTTRLF